MEFNSVRFTKGITESGRRFEFHDKWTREDRKHLDIGEAWIGYTVFVETGRHLHSAMLAADAKDFFLRC